MKWWDLFNGGQDVPPSNGISFPFLGFMVKNLFTSGHTATAANLFFLTGNPACNDMGQPLLRKNRRDLCYNKITSRWTFKPLFFSLRQPDEVNCCCLCVEVITDRTARLVTRGECKSATIVTSNLNPTLVAPRIIAPPPLFLLRGRGLEVRTLTPK